MLILPPRYRDPFKWRASPFVLSGHNIDSRATRIYKRNAGGGGVLALTNKSVTSGSTAGITLGEALNSTDTGNISTSVGAGWVAVANEYYTLAPVGLNTVSNVCEFRWSLISGSLDLDPSIEGVADGSWSYTDSGMSIGTIANGGGAFGIGVIWNKNSAAGTAVFSLQVRFIPALLPNIYAVNGAEEVSCQCTLIRT